MFLYICFLMPFRMKAFSTLLLLTTVFVAHSQTFQVTPWAVDISCFNSANGMIGADLEGANGPYYASIGLDTVPIPLSATEANKILHFSGPANDEGVDIWSGTTSFGDVYAVIGIFNDSLVLDSSHTLYSNGLQDGFTAAYSADNDSLLWVSQIGGTGDDEGIGITSDGNKIYATGYFISTAQFGNTTLASSGSYNGFIQVIDLATGLTDTVLQIGANGSDEIRQLAFDETGYFYAIGDYTDTVIIGSDTLVADSIDMFVAKFDAQTYQPSWAVSGGGSSADVPFGLALAPNGQIIVSGYVADSAAFDTIIVSGFGNWDAFFASLDTAGNWMWAKNGGGPGYDAAMDVVYNPLDNNIYFTGLFQDSLSLESNFLASNGSYDLLWTKMDLSGNLLQLQAFGGPGTEAGYGIAASPTGQLFVSGQMQGGFSFGADSLSTNGTLDAWVAHIDLNGEDLWSKTLGGQPEDSYKALHLGLDGEAIVTGFFSGDASAYDSTLISAGMKDAIVVRMSQYGQFSDAIFENLDQGEYAFAVFDRDSLIFNDTLHISEPDSFYISANLVPTLADTAVGSIDLSAFGGTAPYTFSWSTADSTEDLQALTSGTYTVTVTDSNGCALVRAFTIDTVGVLSASAIVSDMSCANTSNGSINITIAGGLPPFSYVWNTGASTEDISSLPAGNYTVTVADSIGQEFILNATVSQNTVHPTPTPGPISGSLQAQSFASYIYQVPATNGSSYTWAAIGGTVLMSAGNTAEIDWGSGPEGTIIVTEENQYGCIGTDSAKVSLQLVGISEAAAALNITLFPNPASHMLHVQLPAGVSAAYKVVSIAGTVYFGGQLVDEINVATLPAGTYLLELEVSGTSVRKLFVKQ